jgi:hypothetical protein
MALIECSDLKKVITENKMLQNTVGRKILLNDFL